MHKRGWLQWVILSLAIVLLSSHAVTPALASNARPILVNCGAVYTVDPDGSHRNLVFREIWNTRPVLSPAGQLIAWSMAPYHSYARIEMVNVDGSGRHEITNGQLNGQNFYAQNPAWSPDGRRLAFFGSLFNQDWPIDKQGLFVMNADGTEIQFLVAVFYLAQLAWSPDGQNIVATDGTGIVVMGADGSNRLQLTDKSPNNVNTDPAWTPDSRFITFVSNRDGAQHLYLMNIDGTNVHPLVQSSADQTNRARSPDGSQIAFISRADGHSWPYVMNADGTGKHVLFKADCYSVSWR